MENVSYVPTPGHFEFIRDDGVRFLGDTHSPNGTPFHEVQVRGRTVYGYIITAHDAAWASRYVGRFATLVEALVVIDGYEMPTR